MANISATMVKSLRDKTGAGMMDCKRALVDANGDIDIAMDNLRKAGIVKAEKKSSRAVKEGKILSSIIDGQGVLIEVLCETDFVATNPKFIKYVGDTATSLLKIDTDGDISAIAQEQENDTIIGMISTIGENMQLRRAVNWKSNGKIASYLHMGGRIGVMIDVEGETDEQFLTDICMHIAAFKPEFISSDEISESAIEKEKEIAKAQLVGKPEEIIDKILVGKINKWFSEVCLNNQPWIKDDKSSLSKLKPNVKVKRFIRWEMGEEL